MANNYMPEGYHTITPSLLTEDGGKLLSFLVSAFDATVLDEHRDAQQSLVHALARIGDSCIMVGSKAAAAGSSSSGSTLCLYVPDIDAVYAQAIAAGATSVQEPCTQFYGDRNAVLRDFAGNEWWVATRLEHLSKEEKAKRAQEFIAKYHNK